GGIVRLTAPAATTCGSKACWTLVGLPTTGMKYKDGTKPPLNDGVKGITGKSRAAGAGQILWTAKGATIPSFALGTGLALPVSAQVVTNDDGCWEADFSTSDVKANSPVYFRATHKAP